MVTTPKRSNNGLIWLNDMTRRATILLLFLLCCLRPAAGQELDDLRNSLKLLEDQKQMTTELLSKTQTNLDGVVKNKKLLESKIKNSRSIVTNLERQTDLISTDIEDITDTIGILENRLDRLRGEYSDMVYDAYKNYKVNNFMVFLFAAKDFNDVNRRIAYMRMYNRMRQRKADEIRSTSSELNARVTEMVDRKSELDGVRRSRSNELTAMAKDESALKTSEQKLRQQVTTYSTTIQSQERQMADIQKKIAAMVAQAAKANQAAPRTDAEREFDVLLTGQFDQNQGKLPFPVKGVVIDRFGTHAHSTQRGVTVTNNGVNIASTAGAEVRCVFEGVVTMLSPIPGMRNSIIVRHGTYYTVYSNLETISVKVGDKVSLNHVLGRLDRSEDDDSNFLHFELWRERPDLDPATLDPEKWLRRL